MTMNSGSMGSGSMAHDIRTGVDVYTSDGEKIGSVKEIRGAYFKIDAMGPDYWLSNAKVGRAGTDGVYLTFDKDHLGDHKEDESRIAAA